MLDVRGMSLALITLPRMRFAICEQSGPEVALSFYFDGEGMSSCVAFVLPFHLACLSLGTSSVEM